MVNVSFVLRLLSKEIVKNLALSGVRRFAVSDRSFATITSMKQALTWDVDVRSLNTRSSLTVVNRLPVQKIMVVQ